MSLTRIYLNKRKEFLIKCDHCDFETNSVDDKFAYMAQAMTCPYCKREISFEMTPEVPQTNTDERTLRHEW